MDKPTLLATLRAERAAWERLLDVAGEGRLEQPALPGGWSIADLAGHITAYEAWLADWLEAAARGVLAEPAVVNEPDLDGRNAKIYQRYRGRPGAVVMVEARASFARLLRALEALPEADFDDPARTEWFVRPFWGSALPLWDCIAGDSYEHYHQHLADVQAAIFSVAPAWRSAYPGAAAGVLVVHGVANPAEHAGLAERKAALEAALRERYAGLDRAGLAQIPALRAYAAYYKRFRKTYHVQLQLESVAFKAKPLPHAAALVEAMFMAELQDLLLTAGHDLQALDLPLTLDAARGDETYTLLRGEPETLKPGDMFIADRQGVVSSILYGPDRRTRITPETRAAVFTTYAPPGIGEAAVAEHLRTLEANVRAIAPQAEVVLSQVVA
jgi:DNA/RNA-binding domain of Phe-tRNA-synthetase-like protein